MSPAERGAAWTKIWTAAAERFVGFDRIPYVDWNREYEDGLAFINRTDNDVEIWRDMRRRIALLQNGRTYLRFPNTLPKSYDTVPIRMVLLGDKVLVRKLSDSPNVMSSGVKVGDELISIDGHPTMTYVRAVCYEQTSGSTDQSRLASSVHRIFTGPQGSNADCVFRRPSGTEYSIKLNRDTGPASEWYSKLDKAKGDEYRELDGGIIYLNCELSITRGKSEALAGMVSSAPGPKAIIVDLRDVQGGIFPESFVRRIATSQLEIGGGEFVQRTPRPAGWPYGTLEFESSLVGEVPVQVSPDTEPYAGAVVFLTGPETMGSAEQMIGVLFGSKRITLIGDTTGGAANDVEYVTLIDGAALTLAVTRPVSPDGFGDGRGYPPHIFVRNSAKDFADGKDVVLTRALQFIKSGK